MSNIFIAKKTGKCYSRYKVIYMKKKTIIILSVILILLVALGIFGYNVYKNYISPILEARSLSIEELKEKTDDKKIIEDITGLEIRDLTDEEKEQIEKGEKTESEIMEELIKDAAKENGGKSSSDKKAPADASAITAKYLSELYALQAKYTGIIEGLIPEIRAYYYDLRDVKKYDVESAVTATSKAYLGRITGAEAECDAKVNSIISRMEKELKANGHSTAITSTVKSRYESEKASKRAYYFKLLTGN